MNLKNVAKAANSAVVILTERELRRCVRLDKEALGVVESAFTALAQKHVVMPPIQHISVSGTEGARDHVGDVDIKSALIPGLDLLAVKIASGFFGNVARGLPSGSGLMEVLDAHSGFCRAILLDNGFLTDLRTALAGGVAANYLAPTIVDVAGVIGTGRQAELQALALHLVRPFKKLLVHGRNPAHADRLIKRLADQLADVDVEFSPSAQGLVEQSQCIVTTTASREPIVRAEWLQPGQHITAMGSDLPGKQELHAAVLRRADLCVFDRFSQCERLGELQHVDVDNRVKLRCCELGDVTSGQVKGRTQEDQITVCDLTGTGAQDTAIAVHAFEVALRLGLGNQIETA